jgi:hypothetical protein
MMCFTYKIFCKILSRVARDSSVGILTRYGTDGLRIESRCGRGFPATAQTVLGAHLESCENGTGSIFWGRAWPCHSLPSRAEITKNIELYLS